MNRPFRQLAHFRRDHGEALAGLAGPGRLDGGVQREQVRLGRDVVDQFKDLADLLGVLPE
jgi:hypothetical protein